MIDFYIVVVEVVCLGARPGESRRVKSVSSSKVVRKRHEAQIFLNQAGRIEDASIRVATEHAYRLKFSGRRRRLDRVAVRVNSWHQCNGVSVLHSGKEPEQALAGGRRQYRSSHVGLFPLALAFIQEVEEGFVLSYRPAYSGAELIAYQDVARVAAQVIVPLVGVQSCVAVRFEDTAMELVGS